MAEKRFRNKYVAMAYLLANGWTQAETAEILGVTPRTIRRWKKKIRKNPILMSDSGVVVPIPF